MIWQNATKIFAFTRKVWNLRLEVTLSTFAARETNHFESFLRYFMAKAATIMLRKNNDVAKASVPTSVELWHE
jgi:hypothetical protein